MTRHNATTNEERALLQLAEQLTERHISNRAASIRREQQGLLDAHRDAAVLDHPDGSITIAKLAQEILDHIANQNDTVYRAVYQLPDTATYTAGQSRLDYSILIDDADSLVTTGAAWAFTSPEDAYYLFILNVALEPQTGPWTGAVEMQFKQGADTIKTMEWLQCPDTGPRYGRCTTSLYLTAGMAASFYITCADPCQVPSGSVPTISVTQIGRRR